MTASINTNDPKNPKRVLMVASNPATSTQTGWPIGFWWAELTHPYWEFTEHGYEVVIASPDGGPLTADGFSDPEDQSGYSASDLISLGFKKNPVTLALIENTPALADVDVDGFDAVFFVGGQGPMYTFVDNPAVDDVLRTAYEAGKPTAVVCHATAILLAATAGDGSPIVAGKTWTGFADAEEAYADQFAGQKIQPFWIETEAGQIENTTFVAGPAMESHAIVDGNLVTGQQQHSGAEAARLAIGMLA